LRQIQPSDENATPRSTVAPDTDEPRGIDSRNKTKEEAIGISSESSAAAKLKYVS
jgi:hypothetical protein